MNPSNSPTSGVIVTRKAHQMVDESIGPCRRTALWCSNHHSVWAHGQTPGCNDYSTAVEAATALLASAYRG